MIEDQLEVRIIFQGGGARLVTLLAAARAIEKIDELAPRLKIKQVAGVSAGSIAAAALASKTSVGDIRERFRQEADNFTGRFAEALERLEPLQDTELRDVIKQAMDRLNANKSVGFGLARRIAKNIEQRKDAIDAAFSIYRGSSLLEFDELESSIREVFSTEGSPLSFEDLDIPLTVISSDLNSNNRIPYTSEDHPKMELHKALARSSAIPIAFKSYSYGDREYDGALSGNLPFSFFLSHNADNIKTLCFSFENQAKADDDSLLGLVRSIVDCAIDSSMREAYIQTEESGGRVCMLDTSLGTFDFAEAKNLLEKERFDAEVERLIPVIRNALNSLAPFEYPIVKNSRFRPDHASTVVDKLIGAFPYKRVNAIKVYIDGEAKSSGVADETQQDERHFVEDIAPVADDGVLVACSVSLIKNVTKISDLNIEAFLSSAPERGVLFDQELSPTIYVHEDFQDAPPNDEQLYSDQVRKRFRALLLFETPIPAANCPVRIKVKEEGDKVIHLTGDNSRGWDWFTVAPPSRSPFEKFSLIGVHPKSNGGGFSVQNLDQVSADQMNVIRSEIGRQDDFNTYLRGSEIEPDKIRGIVREICSTSLRASYDCWGYEIANIEAPRRAGCCVAKLEP